MKKTVSTLLTLGIYILLLLWLVDFSVMSVFDGKTLLVLVLGTTILTISDRLGGQTTKETHDGQLRSLIPIIRKSLMVTGYAATLLLLFFGLKTHSSDAIRGLVEAGRPLMYSFVLAQLLDLFQVSTQLNTSTQNDESDPSLLHGKPSNQEQEANGIISEAPFTAFLLSHNLSTREVEIAELVAQGRTNAEIAEQLFISAATVKKHLQRIFEKIGVKKREQLMLLRLNGQDTSIVR